MRCPSYQLGVCHLRIAPCWLCPRRDSGYSGADKLAPHDPEANARLERALADAVRGSR